MPSHSCAFLPTYQNHDSSEVIMIKFYHHIAMFKTHHQCLQPVACLQLKVARSPKDDAKASGDSSARQCNDTKSAPRDRWKSTLAVTTANRIEGGSAEVLGHMRVPIPNQMLLPLCIPLGRSTKVLGNIQIPPPLNFTLGRSTKVLGNIEIPPPLNFSFNWEY